MSQEQKITDTLAGHQWYDATSDNEDPATGCTGCDDWFGSEDALDDGTFAAHQAAVLAPIIREAQAEALKSTAEAMRQERHSWCLDDAGRYWIKRTLNELEERADNLSKEDQ